ncbi:MAG TPA: hypothetical protein VFP98_05550 [Candidatus Polarisedimenticolia bacterium]|nr:hypothetical protein [Candidatus Polarisedimenticolia bacterium]
MLVALALAASLAAQEAPGARWVGFWTYDSCHEDRKPDHDKDTFCREGRDRLEIAKSSSGSWDIRLCPADPWGETGVGVDPSGRQLTFRTRDGLDVRLTIGEDPDHFRGVFRSGSGHSGRVWGRRLAACR